MAAYPSGQRPRDADIWGTLASNLAVAGARVGRDVRIGIESVPLVVAAQAGPLAGFLDLRPGEEIASVLSRAQAVRAALACVSVVVPGPPAPRLREVCVAEGLGLIVGGGGAGPEPLEVPRPGETFAPAVDAIRRWILEAPS